MASFIVLAAMKGRFYSENGNTYDNFQMMGYVEAATPTDAVTTFFDQPHFPIRWEDVQYLWAERLTGDPENCHYGDFEKVYVDSLRRRWDKVDPS
jgi:hypothetical protein